ncbi:MAG: molecular chaperone DnaK [Magnetococcus sp. YQC-5]
MSKIIGIDLGTTNSCVSILENGEAMVLENMEGGRTTPSMVAYSADGERRVGQTAKRQMVVNPENTLFAIKRLMGRRYNDPVILREKNLVAYKIIELENGDAGVEVWGQKMAPAEVSSIILQKMKKIAEDYLGESVKDAVITVPAYFTESQRQATRDAGRIAGLNVMRIINEPTAAALAYGLDKDEGKTIAVFDLGGGTFDISILEIGEGVFQVKATNGDTFLGGEDFDHRVINYLAEEFMKIHQMDPRGDKEALQRIKEAAETARIELSTSLRTEINLPFLCFDATGPKNLKVTLTRAKLEQLVEDLIARTIAPCELALKDAGFTVDKIDEVILAGGMTRMPKIRQTVAKFFGMEPRLGVNPDEIVAMGAAIQAGVLGGEIRDVLLLDVTPLSLGIETKGGIFNVLIPKNETIPCLFSKTFSTVMDNQKFATVRVAQGERGIFNANHFLGEFTLDGIPPAPRGTPRIEVSFVVDADGMVKASAIDKATGREQSIRVKVSGGLEEQEIQTMIRDAEKHAEEDARQQRMIQVINQADSALYTVKSHLSANQKTMDKELREQLEAGIERLQRVMEVGKDLNEISDLSKLLTNMITDTTAIPASKPFSRPVAKPHAAPNKPIAKPERKPETKPESKPEKVPLASQAEDVSEPASANTETFDLPPVEEVAYAMAAEEKEPVDGPETSYSTEPIHQEVEPEQASQPKVEPFMFQQSFAVKGSTKAKPESEAKTVNSIPVVDIQEEAPMDPLPRIRETLAQDAEMAYEAMTHGDRDDDLDLEMDPVSMMELDRQMDAELAAATQEAEEIRLLSHFVANPMDSVSEEGGASTAEVINMVEMAEAILQRHRTAVIPAAVTAEAEEEEWMALAS